MTELIVNAIQLFCVAVGGVFSFAMTLRRRSRRWAYLALFYLSFGLGLMYWVLYLIFFHTTPLVFCVSELSWTVSYIFLAIRLSDGRGRERAGALPWLLPAFSLMMGVFFCLRGSYFENLIMGAGLAACGYFALEGLILARRHGRCEKMWICGAVLFFYAAEYLLWLAGYVWLGDVFWNPYFLADTFLLNPALILLAAAQYQEDLQCHTT